MSESSNQKTELFELCKHVYEATGWTDTHQFYSTTTGGKHLVSCHFTNQFREVPIYTSDYLLEKLTYWKLRSTNGVYEAEHKNINGDYFTATGDTPIKALLKLTLALHKAGGLL